jgi:hypothetical protein
MYAVNMLSRPSVSAWLLGTTDSERCLRRAHCRWSQDSNLRHTLQFGVGLHHAGLNENDRSIVEHLFVSAKIQVRSPVRQRPLAAL